MVSKRTFIGAGLIASSAAAALHVARTAGASAEEVAGQLPGDELLPDADLVTTRGITIAAPAAQIWPWLIQMGYHRGGWYAVDALERAIGAGDFLTGGSADQIVPELQDLAVGDRIQLSESLHFVVARLERDRDLVLALPDAPLDWVWSFSLREAPDAATRLIIRTRVSAGPRAPWIVPLLPVLDAGHMMMELVQLRRLRARVLAAAAA